MEQWRVVTEDRSYEVSNLGHVRSLNRESVRSDGRRCFTPGRELVLSYSPDGYQYVRLHGGRRRSVHRLVAMEFCTGYADLLQVNHKNGVRDDNRAENLEWVTQSANLEHAYRVLGRRPARDKVGRCGAENHKARAVVALDPMSLVVVHRFDALREAERFGFMSSHVSLCINGRKAQYKGLVWRAESITEEVECSL